MPANQYPATSSSRICLILAKFIALTFFLSAAFPVQSQERLKELIGENAAGFNKAEIIKIEKLIDSQKYQDAWKIVEAALKREPNNVVLISFKVDLLAIRQNKFVALEYISGLVVQNKKNHLLRIVRGTLLKKNFYALSAKNDFLDAYEINPKSSIILRNLYEFSIEEGDYSKALDYLKELHVLTPKDPAPYFWAAKLESYMGMADEAIASLEKALALNPSALEYLEMAVSMHLRGNRPERALSLLEKAIAMNIDEEWPVNQYVSLLVNLKQRDKADAFLLAGIARHADKAVYSYNMGYLKLLENQLDEAERYMLKALSINPGHNGAKAQLYWIYWQRREYSKAVPILEELATKKIRDPSVYIYLARYYNSEGRIFAAEDIILSGLEVSPDNQNLLFEYGQVLFKKKRYKEAISIMEGLVAVDDTQINNGELGIFLYEAGRLEDAEIRLAKAFSMGPGNSRYSFFYNELLYELQRNDILRQVAENTSVSPDIQSRAYFLLSKLEYDAGNEVKALGFVNKALILNEGSAEIQAFEATLLAARGSLEPALYSIESALEKSPNEPRELVRLKVLLALKRDAEALEAIKNFELQHSPSLFVTLVKNELKSKGYFKKRFFSGSKQLKVFEALMRSPSYKENKQAVETLDEASRIVFEAVLQSKYDNVPLNPPNLKKLGRPAKLNAATLFFLPFLAHGIHRVLYAEAIVLARESQRRFEFSPELAGIIANMNLGLKNYEDAVVDFKLFLKAYPDNIWAKSMLAYAYDFTKNYAESEALYKEILDVDPEDSVALNNLAWLFVSSMGAKGEKLDEALMLASKAVALRPGSDNLDTLAEVLFQKGRYHDALIMIEKALAVDQRNFDHFKKQRKKILKAIQEGIKASADTPTTTEPSQPPVSGS